MRVNKEELKKMAEKSDEELWASIKEIAKSHGFNLPEETPKKENLEKIRGVLSGNEKFNLSDATKIINSYKNKRS